MRSPAKQRLHGTELGYSSHGSSQNKSVGIDTQARCRGKPTAETRGNNKSNGHHSLCWPCLPRRLAGKDAPHQVLLKCSKMEIKLVLSRMHQAAAIRRKKPILFSSAQ